MADYTNVSTKDLVMRLNELIKGEQSLIFEWNDICYELWERIPSISNDADIKPKTLSRQITYMKEPPPGTFDSSK